MDAVGVTVSHANVSALLSGHSSGESPPVPNSNIAADKFGLRNDDYLHRAEIPIDKQIIYDLLS